MIRIIATLFAVTLALTAFLNVAPALAPAADVVWISSTGVDSASCTALQPCQTFNTASGQLTPGGQINCLNSPGQIQPGFEVITSLTIDCAGVYVLNFPSSAGFQLQAANQVVKIRNLTVSGVAGGYPGIKLIGSGTLILENCAFENLAGTALDIEPTGALNLVIKNSRISNNAAAGVIIKPAAGGSVTATFDGVTITNNAGGLKTDTTNGAVKVDIYNSTISNNANNGLVALGGAGGLNMMTVKNDVIASNGQAGIEASFGTAAVLVNNTVLDSNMTGATLTLSGGKILTYGNNSTIGNPGSGFTGTAPLN